MVEPTQDGPASWTQHHHSRFFKNIHLLWQKNVLCDLQIDINDKAVACHSIVLAANSSKLAHELVKTKDEESGSLGRVADILAQVFERVSYETAMTVMHFLYTGKVEIERANLRSLELCADRLDLGALKIAIESEKYSREGMVRTDFVKLENDLLSCEENPLDVHTPKEEKMQSSNDETDQSIDNFINKETITADENGASPITGHNDDDGEDVEMCLNSDVELDYFCGHCGKNIEDEKLFLSHMEKCVPQTYGGASLEESNHKQSDCNESMEESDHKRSDCNESREESNHKSSFLCGKCCGVFDSPDSLEHGKSCMSEKSDGWGYKLVTDKSNSGKIYECEYCKKRYKSELYVKTHIKTLHKGEHFACDSCEKKFVSKSYLKTHFEVHHAGSSESFVCEYCSKQYKFQASLKSHVEFVHKNKKRKKYPLQSADCPICKKTMSSQSNLSEHIKRVHVGLARKRYRKNDKKPFSCPDCGLSLPQRLPLATHRHNAHGVPVPEHFYKFSCRFCEKKFYNGTDLQNHEAAHMGVRNHCCDLCGASFVQNSGLRRHMLSHTDAERFKCPVGDCSYTTYTKHKLTDHCRNRHKDPAKQVSESFRCAECNTIMNTDRLLRIHMKKNHNAYPCRKKDTFASKQEESVKRIPYYHCVGDKTRFVGCNADQSEHIEDSM